MGFENFEFAFWHPFGPHGGETPKDIIQRKRTEIESNGWTLWSFQYRPMINDWHLELSAAGASTVYTFCSDSSGAVDPDRDGSLAKAIDCETYRFVGEPDEERRPIPAGVRVPHPFRPRKRLASAFVVRRIMYPVEPFERPAVEWFSPRKGPWCQTVVPTRGEYLIRRGGTIAMRGVSAVLELRPPYLAIVAAWGQPI